MAALDSAREVAEQNGATLLVLHVAPLPISATEMSPIPQEPFPVWEQVAKARLEKVAIEYLEGRGVSYKTRRAAASPRSVSSIRLTNSTPT
jgi:hypothetical protein